MAERVKRMTAAAGNEPSVMAGRMMLWGLVREPVGNQSMLSAMNRISIRPSQKLGTAWPNRASNLLKMSVAPPRRTAATMPSGMPMAKATKSPAAPSWTVATTRSPTTSVAGRVARKD